MGRIISGKAVLEGQDIIAMYEIHRRGFEFFKSWKDGRSKMCCVPAGAASCDCASWQ